MTLINSFTYVYRPAGSYCDKYGIKKSVEIVDLLCRDFVLSYVGVIQRSLAEIDCSRMCSFPLKLINYGAQ